MTVVNCDCDQARFIVWRKGGEQDTFLPGLGACKQMRGGEDQVKAREASSGARTAQAGHESESLRHQAR